MRGNYFQTNVNEAFRKSFTVQPHGTILDVGCGDGQYSNLLAKNVKQSRILAIDSSEGMIQHANQHWAHKNLSFEVCNIEEFDKPFAFDFALSFWCLHWTNIELAFPNIFNALKNGGRLYAVLSSFSDNSILQAWRELGKLDRHKDLLHTNNNVKNNVNNLFFRVVNIFNQLAFKQTKLDIKTVRVCLPNADYFKHLLRTMPFITALPSEKMEGIIDDLLEAFQTICLRKYGGKLYYETRPIFLEAVK